MPLIIVHRSIILLYLGALHSARSDVIEKPVFEVSEHERNATVDGQVTETRYASCRIATENMAASAHAAVTRVLKGACDAKTVEEKFQKLEKNLTRELEEIKGILYAILNQGSSSDILVLGNRSMMDEKFQAGHGLVGEVDDDESPRREEIKKLNGTTYETWTADGLSKVFVYYWMVRNFREKLERWKSARSERSQTFYVGESGYAMYLRATPRYFPDGTMFVGLGLTHGRYDSCLKWPFRLRTRLEILDQSLEQQQREDRMSRIWSPSTLCSEIFWSRPKFIEEPDNPICVGLSISREIILARSSSSLSSSPLFHRNQDFRYLWKGNLLVKLTVYM